MKILIFDQFRSLFLISFFFAVLMDQLSQKAFSAMESRQPNLGLLLISVVLQNVKLFACKWKLLYSLEMIVCRFQSTHNTSLSHFISKSCQSRGHEVKSRFCQQSCIFFYIFCCDISFIFFRSFKLNFLKKILLFL